MAIAFVEFQAQRDNLFYERFVSEIFLYLRQNPNVTNWRAIAVIDLAVTIMVYKFENLTREEVQAMFTVSDLKQTRFYQDMLEECLEREKVQIVKQLTRQVGELSPALIKSVKALVNDELDLLWDTFPSFKQVSDLEVWLKELNDQSE